MNLDRLYRRNYPIVAAIIAALGVIGIALVANVGRSQVIEARLTERVKHEAKKEAAKAVAKEVNREVADEVTQQLDDRLLAPSTIPTHDLPPEFRPVDPATTTTVGPYDPSTTTTSPPPPDTSTTITIPEVPTTVTIPEGLPLP